MSYVLLSITVINTVINKKKNIGMINKQKASTNITIRITYAKWILITVKSDFGQMVLS